MEWEKERGGGKDEEWGGKCIKKDGEEIDTEGAGCIVIWIGVCVSVC